MKKYLINGAMALIVGGFLASCTHDDVGAPATVDQMTKSFDEMFTELYGPIAPNHNWGFATVAVPAEAIAAAEAEAAAATRAATRGYNPNANEWVSNGGWVVPRELSEEQRKRVIAYFQSNQLEDGGEKDWINFFVQQVYKGGEDNGKYVNIMKAATPLTTEKYQSLSMSTAAYGSGQMNKLYANGSDHIGNYNNATCSENTNVQNYPNVEYINDNHNGTHRDYIQLMVNSKAKDFGYLNSETSQTVSDHYTLVDGSVIDEWAKKHGNNIGESVTGRAFVGFDYDLLTPSDWYTNTEFKITDIDGSINHYTQNGKATEWAGASQTYTDALGNPIKYLQSKYNMMSGTRLDNIHNNLSIQEVRVNGDYKGKTFDKAKLDLYISQGYRPISNYNWAIPSITRDHYYSDWIVCIFPGDGVYGPDSHSNPDAYKESKTKKTYTHKKIVDQGRVFCEDIATANMKVTEDIDYNDIVFDARVWQIYDQDATTVNNITSNSDPYNYRWQYDISLLATGGTIEEKINGIDVHNKFGVGQSFMVNTWTPNCVSTLSGQWNTRPMEAVDFSYTLKYNELPAAPSVGINTIPIEVHYGGKQMVALENRNIEERTGEDGNKYIVSSAPYKLCLPVGTQWPIERANIQSAYPDFSSYVSSPNYLFYKGTPVSDKLYTQAPESSIQKDGKTTESPEEVTQSGDAENSNVYVVWKGDESKDGSAITLYNFTFQSGQTLRFFGSGTITVVCGEGSSKKVITDGSMSAGYVDAPIDDAEEAAMLSQGIFVTGSFTLTKIVVL
jgi:hypothetical protein